MCQSRSTPMTFPYNRGWETQPNSRGENIPIIRIPIKGGMTIPNIATFDHGTYDTFRKKMPAGIIKGILATHPQK